ncbi:MAG: class I SAM-dependent methyltransferase [Chloroflexia bacterium]
MDASAIDLVRFALDLVSGARVQRERTLIRQMRQDVSPLFEREETLTILDLGNGWLRPHLSLLQETWHRAVGIDLVNRRQPFWTEYGYRLARLLFVLRAGLPLRTLGGLRLVCGDAGKLPFDGASFDLVLSILAFEHFLDVPSVVAEVKRVLRPGGLLWACIHPFTCPSGAHNLTRIGVPCRRIPRGVEPWDHLRKRRLAFPVPLNGWRIPQYLDAIGQRLEIVRHYCFAREGERWLTPEIRAELSAYNPDELTCMRYVIVARKGAGA